MGRVAKLKQWVRTHRTRAIAGVGAIIVLVAGGIAYGVYASTAPDPLTGFLTFKPKPKYYAPLTGLLVKDEKATTKAVTAIMIENSPDARPQSGLKAAEVVYEAVAEGGITRFVALYQQNKPHLVGPVRSVRMYYVDWLAPYNASVAHVGGSYRALKVIRSGGYRDIDQFFNPNYYWRASDRYAPHNVYTSFDKLDALNKSKGYKTSQPKTIARSDQPVPKKLTAKNVSMSISSALYNPSYVYDPKTGMYNRFLAGAKHIDRERGQIQAKVVVALRVHMTSVLEDGYREAINTNGPGEAVVFQNGVAYKVTWHKGKRKNQLSFTKADGTQFSLARGKTWISAVPVGSGSVSWK